MEFSPFEKPLSKLTATDLKVLKSTSEGWYAEYKRELPKKGSKIDTLKIAKSITSFANTYGGWLFYGIEESESQKAGEFCGITHPVKAEMHVREALVYQSNPEPYFETKIIEGPCKVIGLIKGRSILVIRIPKSNSLPHVHGSGRIYRRVADSSEPIAEKDRARLDAMWAQKEGAHNSLKKFFETCLNKAVPYTSPVVHVFLMTDPLRTKGHVSSMNFKDFNSIMKEDGLHFDNVYSASNHYVARQTKNNDVNMPLFTWQYYNTGASFVSIPLNSCLMQNSFPEQGFSDIFSKYAYSEQFKAICLKQGIKTGYIVDLNYLLMILVYVIKKHKSLLLQDEILFQPCIKFKFENVGNVTPFINLETYMQYLTNYGLPAPLYNQFYFPDNESMSSFVIPEFSPASVLEVEAVKLFFPILQCFGIPVQALFFEGEDIKKSQLRMIEELFKMWNSSKEKN